MAGPAGAVSFTTEEAGALIAAVSRNTQGTGYTPIISGLNSPLITITPNPNRQVIQVGRVQHGVAGGVATAATTAPH